jgi:NAD(P)-dependent dehydrogenase (short-subunit alcohol dehydrogenase family)
MPKQVMLAGATGGIGSALLQQLLRDSGVGRIFATTRGQPNCEHDKITWLTLDYTVAGSPQQLVEAVTSHTAMLDQLICATGYLHGAHGQPEKSLSALALSDMEYSYRVNAAGPMTLFSACVPLLRKAEQAKIAVLSAQVGSIEDNHLGGWFSYRMAKAALNMGIKSASIEAARWRNGASVVAIHPGTTHSDLSKPFVARRKQPVRSAAETGAKLYHLIQTADAGDNGRFLTADGNSLPW